jgi:rhamnosyltransferase subunit B
MRVLFVPFGSEGDVNPLIWLAEGLVERGHAVHFLITPHYRHLVERRGFAWTPIGTEEEFARFARDPRLWAPRVGPYTVIEGMKNTLSGYPEPFAATGGDFDLMVVSTLGLAASSLAEARGIPRLTLHMQPACVRSAYDCPLFIEEMAWLLKAPAWVKRAFFWMVDRVLWNLARKPLNDFRHKLGLAPIRRFYDDALQGTEGVAALFPEWFAAPQPDWPPRLRQFGFPINPASHPLPVDVEKFLAAGEPPIVWTHGSANFDIEHFQAAALRISAELGARCLLVSLDPPKQPLPPGAYHAAHVRFEDLFPRCRTIVHHGGIGTTAKAIAAGVPQLIVPRSHDQPDNAYRVSRLGLGITLPYSALDGDRINSALAALWADGTVIPRCRDFSEKIRKAKDLQALCTWCEELAGKSMT